MKSAGLISHSLPRAQASERAQWQAVKTTDRAYVGNTNGSERPGAGGDQRAFRGESWNDL